MPIQYIKNIKNGSVIGYKYFDIQHNKGLKLTLRGNAKGIFTVFTSLTGESCGKIPFKLNSDVWKIISGNVKIPSGVHSIYLRLRALAHWIL